MSEPERYVTLEVSREHGQLQLSINLLDGRGVGHGYRIAGPKFAGGSEPLLTHRLDADDVKEIRGYLDAWAATVPRTDDKEPA